VAGTVDDDAIASVTVTNHTLSDDYTADLRRTLFIARAVELDVGDNDLFAVAHDRSGNQTRYPSNEQQYHTVTFEQPQDLTYVFDHNGCLTQVMQGETVLREYGNASRCLGRSRGFVNAAYWPPTTRTASSWRSTIRTARR